MANGPRRVTGALVGEGYSPSLSEVRLDLLAHGHALAQVLLGGQPDGPNRHRCQQRADRRLAECVAQHDQ